MSGSNLRYIAKPNISSDSSSITGSSQVHDVDLPISNISDNILSRLWRTGKSLGYFRVYTAGDNQNNKMDVNFEGVDDVTATLTVDEYTGATLATEIQTRLAALTDGSGTTCTYSASTNKFTIAKTSGTLRLLTNAAVGTLGVNQAISIWNDIGFDTSANKTGALSYEADNKAMHMEEFAQFFFGSVTIRDATTTVNSVTQYRNDKINFKEASTGSELTAIIPPKTYTINELVEEIEYQMEVVGDNDYQVLYDEKTKKISITTDGTFLSLLWASGTNGYTLNANRECWYLGVLIGIDDSTFSDDTGATSYTMDFPVYPNGITKQITEAAIFGHTLTSSATIELYFRNMCDHFMLNNDLESLNNPNDTMTWAGSITANWVIQPGNVDLGNGLIIT